MNYIFLYTNYILEVNKTVYNYNKNKFMDKKFTFSLLIIPSEKVIFLLKAFKIYSGL